MLCWRLHGFPRALTAMVYAQSHTRRTHHQRTMHLPMGPPQTAASCQLQLTLVMPASRMTRRRLHLILSNPASPVTQRLQQILRKPASPVARRPQQILLQPASPVTRRPPQTLLQPASRVPSGLQLQHVLLQAKIPRQQEMLVTATHEAWVKERQPPLSQHQV